MPLFLTPGVGATLGPPDPVLEAWKERVAAWRARLRVPGSDPDAVGKEMTAAGLRAMPVRDQMDLQWTMIAAGISTVLRARGSGRES